jgi:hypothetical protein
LIWGFLVEESPVSLHETCPLTIETPTSIDFCIERISCNFTGLMQVTFNWEGKEHTGILKQVHGAGNLYFLMIKDRFQGQLIRTSNGWQFSTQKNGYIPELAAHFGSLIDGQTQ